MSSILKLRNIGISAHIDSGKTTLTERMLYYAGRIHRPREVRGGDGGATMDSHPIERQRGITIQSTVTSIAWKDHRYQIIDTPGHVDFTVEVERSLRVLDGAILVLCGTAGVQSQSLTVDRQMRRYGTPRIAFINKLDRVGADPARVLQQIRDRLKLNAVALQLPIGKENDFTGIVDLIEMQAFYFDGEFGECVRTEDIPTELVSAAQSARMEMLETLAMYDDVLMGNMLAGEPLECDSIRNAIRNATIARNIVPVMLGSAYKNKGIQPLLDAVGWYLPSPVDREVYAYDLRTKPSDGTPNRVRLEPSEDQPLVAMAFKSLVESFGTLTYMRIYQGRMERGASYQNARTGKRTRFGRIVRLHANEREEIETATAGDIVGVAGLDCASGDTFVAEGCSVALERITVAKPVMRLSLQAAKREDTEKLAKALDRFRREDPTFNVVTDPVTGQTLIEGMGQLHLQVYVQRIEEEYDCKCIVGTPSVAYKEHPTKSVVFEHRYKKQNGGPGQFAQIAGRIETLNDSEASFLFIDEVTRGHIARQYIASVEQGFQEALTKGPLGGFEVVGVKAILQDGNQHEKDSSEFSFQQCASEAMREVILPQANVVLLEPIMDLSVEVPSDYQGTVTGNLLRKRGIVRASETIESHCVIQAEVPLAELFDYANEIRSMTQGQGSFSMEPLAYRQTSHRVQESVLAHLGRSN